MSILARTLPNSDKCLGFYKADFQLAEYIAVQKSVRELKFLVQLYLNTF